MLSKGTYEAYRAIADLLVSRTYAPGPELEKFYVASKHIGGRMKEYELAQKQKEEKAAKKSKAKAKTDEEASNS